MLYLCCGSQTAGGGIPGVLFIVLFIGIWQNIAFWGKRTLATKKMSENHGGVVPRESEL